MARRAARADRSEGKGRRRGRDRPTAGLPPVGVADVVERDADGDLFVRLAKADETAPLARLAPDRREAAAGAPGLGDRLLVRFETLEHNKRIMEQLASLRRMNQPAILKALAETFEPGVKELPNVLKQTRESMESGKASDNELVRFWVTYLEKAKKNKDDLFHSWAVNSNENRFGNGKPDAFDAR